MSYYTVPTAILGVVGKDLSDFTTLLETGEYSDLTVDCGRFKFKVHRAVICSRSTYFKNMYNSGLKETIIQEVDLSDDHHAYIARLLIYLYTGGYPMRLLGDKYSKFPAYSQFQVVDQTLEGHDKRRLWIYARMYCIGDKYCVNKLKNYAREECFEDFFYLEDTGLTFIQNGRHSQAQIHCSVAKFVYNSTLSSDRGLRDMFLPILLHAIKTQEGLASSVVQELLRNENQIAFDVAVHRLLVNVIWRCDSCGFNVDIALKDLCRLAELELGSPAIASDTNKALICIRCGLTGCLQKVGSADY